MSTERRDRRKRFDSMMVLQMNRINKTGSAVWTCAPGKVTYSARLY
jgi:hypothetical protein